MSDYFGLVASGVSAVGIAHWLAPISPALAAFAMCVPAGYIIWQSTREPPTKK